MFATMNITTPSIQNPTQDKGRMLFQIPSLAVIYSARIMDLVSIMTTSS
jgi:hypothetical protein